MACACGKNKSNQQTSAQAPQTEPTAQDQQSAANSIANSSRVRRG